MSLSYLIDTDWIINHIRGNERTTRKVEELAPGGIAVSIISHAELYTGVYRSRDFEKSQRDVQHFLSAFPSLDLKEAICQHFGKERSRLRKNGVTIGEFDLLIAATCIHHDLTLLTNNRRHFEQVEDLRILSLS